MRGAYGMAVALSLTIAALMFTLSGYGSMYGNDPGAGLGPAEDRLNSTAENRSVEEGVGGQISGDDPSLVSLTVNGADSVMEVLAFIAFLPTALTNLGFPFWFSAPVGLVVQLLGFVSLVQFASGRVLR